MQKLRDIMHRFMEWLSEEATGKEVIGYIIFAALIVTSLDYTVEAAMENWGLVPSPELPKAGDYPYQYANAFFYVLLLFWGPIQEEVIFRVLPLAFVISFVSQRASVVFGIAMVFTAVFGAIHPYGTAGRIEVAISGFFFSLIFLKCGGMKKRFVKASASTVTVHGLTNAFVILQAWYHYLLLTR